MSADSSPSCSYGQSGRDCHEDQGLQQEIQTQLSQWLTSAQVDLTIVAHKLQSDPDKAISIQVQKQQLDGRSAVAVTPAPLPWLIL